MGLIYKSKNIINNKVYIGQTIQNFESYKNQHIKSALRNIDKNTKYFYNAIRKYGINNFEWSILEDNINSIDELNKKEEYYIKLYNSTNLEFGYNMKSGGLNNIPIEFVKQKISDKLKGIKRSDEFKQKISKTLNNHIVLPETRQKISEGNKNRVITQEMKNKISLIHKGKKLSDETKKLISNKNKGNFHSEETRQKIKEKRKLQIIPKESYKKTGEKNKIKFAEKYNNWKELWYLDLKNNILKNNFKFKKDLFKKDYKSKVYFNRCFDEIYYEINNCRYISKYNSRGLI